MPKKIDSKHFTLYKYPGEFKVSKTNMLAFILYTVDIENNCYKSTLYYRKNLEGEDIKIIDCDYITEFFWEDNKLIISGLLDDYLINDSNEGVPISGVYRFNPDTASIETIFTVYKNINKLKRVSNNSWLMLCSENLNTLKLWNDSNKDKSVFLKAKKHADDFLIVEEWPINSDSEGFRSRNRNRLYLWNDGNLNLITPEYGDVIDFVAFKDKYVVYAIREFENIQPTTSVLYKTSLDTLFTETVDNNQYVYNSLYSLDKNTIIAVRNDRKIYGEYQDEYIDKISLSDGNIKRINEKCDYHLCNSFNVDIGYGAAAQRFKPFNNGVIFISTVEESANIYKGNFDNLKITPLLALEDFMVLDFSVSTEGLVVLGTLGLGGPEIWLYNKNNQVKRISDFNSSISDKFNYSIPISKNIINKNDDTEIHGYIMPPINFDKTKDYPLVLYIHGGPNTTYNAAFYHETQLIAASGYAVAYCNPRGSSGRGADFADLRKKYFTVDKDDILQFLDSVLENYSWLDPSRIAVAGGSYGGIMVNHLITVTDRFNAAISDRSTCNEFSDFFCSDIGLTFTIDVHGGLIWEKDVEKRMRDSSSIFNAPKVTTPTLFIHGENDYCCTKEQSYQMFSALKFCKVPTKLFIAKNETHSLCWSGLPEARIKRLEEIISWLKIYL